MNCSQCDTSLPDSATFCYSCGASTRQAAFSYLPAGAPAWPNSVPESRFYKPEAVAQKPLLTTPAAKRAPKAPRSARSILILAAFIVLTPVIGALATLGVVALNGGFAASSAATSVRVNALPQQATAPASAPTPTTTAQTNQLPTPTSFRTASIREVGITLKYPSDWVAGTPQSSAGNITVSFQPQQQIPIGLSVSKFSGANATQLPSTTILNQTILQGFGSNESLTNMQTLTNTPQHPSIGSANWDEQDATFDTGNGDLVHAVSVSVKHNNIYYNIFYFSFASVYDEAMQKYYSQMLSSFQFLT